MAWFYRIHMRDGESKLFVTMLPKLNGLKAIGGQALDPKDLGQSKEIMSPTKLTLYKSHS